jgi:hypothetical protein
VGRIATASDEALYTITKFALGQARARTNTRRPPGIARSYLLAQLHQIAADALYMVSLVYISSAVQLFSPAALLALLEQSRVNNARVNVTGMLLYKEGSFIQLIEGEDRAVEDLFRTIEMDSRHRGVIRLLKRTIRQRHFADWSMGYSNLKDPELHDVPGFSEFSHLDLDGPTLLAEPNQALKLLSIFKRNA